MSQLANEDGAALEALATTRRRLRAPTRDGEILALPDFDSIGDVVRSNQQLMSTWSMTLDGISLSQIQQLARKELRELAEAYTRTYRNLDWTENNGPIILAGHQPQLFHPGVWIKNFAASAIAQQTGGHAYNLVVDNDQSPSHLTMSVPQLDSNGKLIRGSLQLDQPGIELPFENRQIVSREIYNTIPDRIAQSVSPWVSNPLALALKRHWFHADKVDFRWGAAVAASRHALEGELGLQTAELPIGRLVQGRAFAHFIAEILVRLPEFQSVYQQALHNYRARNHIRSMAHPVPDLKQFGTWWETPFWTWRSGQPHRRPLFAEFVSNTVRLSDRVDWQFEIQSPRWSDAIYDLQQSGVAIRPRAITTTLFARMALCDLFIHGIGGAKYDEITDQLFLQFWQVPPPQFMTLTATMLLPLGIERVSRAQIDLIDQSIRETRFQAEQFEQQIEPKHAERFRQLRQQKLVCLAAIPDRYQRKAWHREISAINHELSELVNPLRLQLLQKRDELIRRLPESQVARWREFGFALHSMGLVEKLRTCVGWE